MVNQIPKLFDPVKFARQGERLAGQFGLSSMKRLMKQLADTGIKSHMVENDIVTFELEFSLKDRAYIATGHYEAEVGLICQRCLEAMRMPLKGDIGLEFVIGENVDSALENSELDLVNLKSETIKLQDLIEDELLLGMPFAPMHGEQDCPASQQLDESGIEEELPDKPNPFAVLAELKRNQES